MFAISFTLQPREVHAWCWGKCGKAELGAFNYDEWVFACCKEKECPHLKRQLDYSFGEFGGDKVYMRRLKPF